MGEGESWRTRPSGCLARGDRIKYEKYIQVNLFFGVFFLFLLQEAEYTLYRTVLKVGFKAEKKIFSDVLGAFQKAVCLNLRAVMKNG